MTLTDFLLARIAEDEAVANWANRGQVMPTLQSDKAAGRVYVNPARVLAECEAKRRIVEWHKAWPVLVEQQPKYEPADGTDPGHFTFRASQQFAWATEQEYRARFGDEPPTGPISRILAAVYADHPDYRDEWRP